MLTILCFSCSLEFPHASTWLWWSTHDFPGFIPQISVFSTQQTPCSQTGMSPYICNDTKMFYLWISSVALKPKIALREITHYDIFLSINITTACIFYFILLWSFRGSICHQQTILVILQGTQLLQTAGEGAVT